MDHYLYSLFLPLGVYRYLYLCLCCLSAQFRHISAYAVNSSAGPPPPAPQFSYTLFAPTPHLFALSCTYSFIQVGSDLASYPWRRCRGTPFASNLFFFFFFSYFRYYIYAREKRDFRPLVLNDLLWKIASILDPC